MPHNQSNNDNAKNTILPLTRTHRHTSHLHTPAYVRYVRQHPTRHVYAAVFF